MNLNNLSFAPLSFVLLPGVAQAKTSCEAFKNGVNAVLEEDGKTSLQWENASSFNGFNSINPTMGIKAAIEFNDKGELIELGASVPTLSDADRTAEPVFVRGMLLSLDPRMTPRKADDLAMMARQRLRLNSNATGSHRVPVAGYTVIFSKMEGGTRYRYDIKAE